MKGERHGILSIDANTKEFGYNISIPTNLPPFSSALGLEGSNPTAVAAGFYNQKA